MEKMENSNGIDLLYADLCNKLRKMGKASSFCQLIKNAASDLDRICILNKDCNIVPSLLKAVKDSRKTNCKDPQQARTTLEAYYNRKGECQSTIENGNLIHLLNLALSQLRVNQQFDFEEFDSFGASGIESLENFLVDSGEDVSDSLPESLLLSDIYRERAECFYDLGDHKMTIVESVRAIRYAKFSKVNPHEHLFLLLFCISRSLSQLNQWQAATNVLQLSIKLLRSSRLDNAKKSVETMKFVKLLKEIQIGSKAQGDRDDELLNLRLCLEPNVAILPEVFDSISGTLANTSSSLQLKWHEDRGRHLIATKTISPGATLIIEHPYSWIVHPNESNSFCQHCCQEIKNLVPCNECCSVVFCSVQCHRASQAYHPYECDFTNMLTSSKILGDMALLCYRTVSTIEFPLLISQIREYHRLAEEIKRGDQTNEQLFRDKFLLGLNECSKLDSSCYNAAFAQTPNTDARVGGDLLKRSFTAVLLTICLRLTGYFKSSEEIEPENGLTENEELIACLFLRHLQSTSCNAYSISKVSGSDPRRLQVNDIGGATYPIISTTNHSCNSNVYRYSLGKVCIVKALREIQCGEEILDSYGPHFASNLIDDRVGLLKGQYLFNCNCSACMEDWSLYPELSRENPCLKCTACVNGTCTKKDDTFSCSKCGNVLDSTKLLQTVTECLEHYQAAKQLLLTANKDSKIDYQKIEEAIVDYTTVLGLTQQWPCQVLIECQETLKLCWNLQQLF